MKKILSIVLSLMITGVGYSQLCEASVYAIEDTIACNDSTFIIFGATGGSEAFNCPQPNGTLGPCDPAWGVNPGVDFSQPYIASPDGNGYLWMGSQISQAIGTPRTVTSPVFNTMCGGSICFDFVYADGNSGQAGDNEQPDEYDEGIALQYSVSNGPWVDMAYWSPNGDSLIANPGVNAPNTSGPGAYETWQDDVCVAIPAAALGVNVRFRFFQEDDSGTCCDHWGIDDISVSINSSAAIVTMISPDSMLVGNIPDTLTVNPTADSTLYEFIVDYGSIQIVDSVMIYTEPTNAGPDVVLDCNTNVVQLLATGVSTTNGVYAWNPPLYLTNPAGISTFASPIDTTDYIFTSSCGVDTVRVNVIANYLFSTSSDTTICVGDAAPLFVYGGAQTYSWTPNDSTINDATIANPIVTPTTTTDYIVVADSAGCLKTDTFTVTVSNKNFVLTLPTPADCSGSNTGSVITPASGAVGAFEYYIYNADSSYIDTSSSPSFTGLFGGDYIVTYSDTMYCDVDIAVTIVGGLSINIDSVYSINPLCVGDTGGRIEIFVDTNVVVNYNINGGPNQTSPIFTGLTDGSYLVSAQVGTCPADTQTVILSAPATVEISFVDSTDLTCGGAGDGEIQVSASNGVMPFQYSIDNVNFFNNAGIIDSLSAGNYTVFVMDNNGCRDSLTTSISEPAPVTITNIVNVNPGCFNDSTGSITFDAINGTMPYTYSIDSGNTFGAVSVNSFPSLWDDSYVLMAQDDNGCLSAVVFDTLVEPTQLVLVEDSTQSSTCGNPDGIVYVSGSGGTPNLTYNIDGGAFQPTGTFTGVSAGIHPVILQDMNGCSETIDVVVIDDGAPTLTIVSADSVSCNGLTDATVQLSVTGGIAPYNFSVNGSPLGPDSLFLNLGGGLQNFLVLDANGVGCQGSADTIIFEPAVLDITASQDSTSCFGSSNGNINLFATGGTPNYLYAVDDTSSLQLAQTFANYASGNYMGYVIDMNGCIDSVAQTVLQADSLIINNIVTDSVNCNGATDGSITFDAIGGVAPYTYSTNGGIDFFPLNTFTVDTGSYDLIVQDASGCFSAIYPVNIYEPTDVVLDSINTTKANCGLSNGSLEVLASGGYGPYSYELNGVITQPTGLFNNVAFMTHTVIVTDVNGCTETINVFVDQNTNLTLSIVSSDSVSCGGAGDATVTVLGAGGISPYAYTVNGGASQTSGTFTNLSGGMNVFTFTDSIGNCIVSDSVDVFEPAILDLTAVQDSVNCFTGSDGEIQLSATGGNMPYAYALNTIGTAGLIANFTGLTAGNNMGYVIDVNGCIDSVAQVVLQPDTLETTTVAVDISCNASGSITVNPTGGTMPYTYSITGGLTPVANVFTITTGGNYTVSVTDANGCGPATAIDSIVAPTPVVYTVDSITSNLLCNGNLDGFIGVAASGGSGPYTYSINGGAFQTDSFFNNLSAGTYSINVQDVFGCPSTATNHVIAEPTNLMNNVSTTTVSCFGLADGTIVINNISGGVAPYNVTIDGTIYTYTAGLIINSLNAGNYNVFIEDANLCNITVLVTVGDVTPIDLVLVNAENVSCFGELDGEIEVSATGGTPIYTFELFTASSSTVISDNSSAIFNGLAGLEAGIAYPILVTDVNGCKDSIIHTLTQPNALTIDSLSSRPESCFGYYDGFIASHVSGGSSPYSYLWSPSGHLGTAADGLTSGVHTVTVTDANGCSVSASETLPAIDPVLAEAIPDSASISMGDTLQLGVIVQNAIGNNLQYSWSPITGLSCTDCQNPSVTAYNDISYSVVVTDENGCMSYNQTEVVVTVDASLFFFIPNGFTPNGDGINDNFQVYGQDVKTVEMMVFNRWGEKVFEGSNQFESWDGTYKGVAQSPGAFTYVIDVTFLNDAQVQKKGSVSLIR